MSEEIVCVCVCALAFVLVGYKHTKNIINNNFLEHPKNITIGILCLRLCQLKKIIFSTYPKLHFRKFRLSLLFHSKFVDIDSTIAIMSESQKCT